MVAIPKEKSRLSILDEVSGCKYEVSLDPNQKWNVEIETEKDRYVLNKGKSGKLYLTNHMFNTYFNLRGE